MQPDKDTDYPRPRLLTSPAQLFAFGFGSGLAPKAPGTVGTVFAVALYLIFAYLPLWQYTLVVLATVAFGIWICGVARQRPLSSCTVACSTPKCVRRRCNI